MSVGFTINHIAAVSLPVLGGYFWMIDYRIPFVAGSAPRGGPCGSPGARQG